MENYGMVVRPEGCRERRRGARRRARSLRRRRLLAGAVLAAALLLPSLWRGLAGGGAFGRNFPWRGPTGGGASSRNSPVEIIYQNPELPNGCEAASMAMALSAAGCPADKLTLYGCLPREPLTERGGQRFGPDPEQAYAGDAAEEAGGWYCFEGPAAEAANRFLTAQGSGLRAAPITGVGRTALDAYAREGTPVVCWVTLEYAQPRLSDSYTWLLPDGTEYHPYRNLHCVVLAGLEGDAYRVADPINGMGTVDAALFWESFSAMGRRAVVIT